jgi:hypothetical protein
MRRAVWFLSILLASLAALADITRDERMLGGKAS